MPFQLELARLKFDALNKYSLFQRVLFTEMNNRIRVDEHEFDLRAMWNEVYINSPEGILLNASILALNEFKVNNIKVSISSRN